MTNIRRMLFAAGAAGGGYSLFTWGESGQGRTGHTSFNDLSVPTILGDVGEWSGYHPGANPYAGCAVKSNGSLWTWGSAGSGAGPVAGTLGHGNLINHSSPVQVGALTDWGNAGFGFEDGKRFIVLKTDGTMWSWGDGANGVLGIGTTLDTSSPVQVGALTTWNHVAVGTASASAIKTDGTMWGWGSAGGGQNGLGTAQGLSRSSPVQIGALTTWTKSAHGHTHAAAISGGKMFCWGYGDLGALGQVTEKINHSSPIQVGALTTWADVACAREACAAVKTDGTLWTWGRGTWGLQGSGTVAYRSSAVQVGALTDWSKIFGANQNFLAIKTDGTLWGWGSNLSGALGDGTVISRSSPVQIGVLTTWITATLSQGGPTIGVTTV